MAVGATGTVTNPGLRYRKGEQQEIDPSKETSSDNTEGTTQPLPIALRDKTLLEKLVSSKEETRYGHIHKILGISCLVSFIYRFGHVLNGRGGNFGPHYGTLAFVLHHWALNLTSFIFEIPHRRIRDGGFRIWPEYRIHSLVFTSRSLACMLLLWYEQRHYLNSAKAATTTIDEETDTLTGANLAIVLATCAAADYGSYLQGEERSNTVRGTTLADPFEAWFASEMQFYLSAFCLVGFDGRYTVHLVAVAIIQLNSFLMTLRRKNVASQNVLTALYGGMLLFGFWVVVWEDLVAEKALVDGTFGAVAVILRMGPLHLNKYVLWTLLGLCWFAIQKTTIVSTYNSEFWVLAFGVTKMVSLGLGLRKRALEKKATKSSLIFRCVIASHALLVLHIGLTLYFGDWEDEQMH